MKMITCPSCTHGSTYDEWYEVSNDDFATCPKCKGNCTYDEFKEDDFK